ncbi:MAG TPA: GNAT family N-acetyltransferase [Micromonosporaceae bacterium]|nr:GNAT family N-acetyltransferase [Micromonosporaceae bacterium]
MADAPPCWQDGPMADVTVVHNEQERRYEARRGDEVMGAAYYEVGLGTVVFTHTEVEPQFEGQGVGSAIARGALDDVRAKGLKVVARCPFINGFIKRHAEYADLLA